MDVINPYSNEVVGTIDLAPWEDVDGVLQIAYDSGKFVGSSPVHRRKSALNSIANGVLGRRDEFAKMIARESGKPMIYALGEVDRAIQSFRVACEECGRIEHELTDLDWTKAGEGKEGLVRYYPRGVVVGISPFNFPLNLVAHKVAPAIAAGCPIILKPALNTPLTAVMLAELIAEIDLPEGAFQLVLCENEVAEKLAIDDRTAMLSFTGSDRVGWHLKSVVKKQKVALELGGNAAMIITQSADPETILAKCMVGAFAYSGQVCIHAQRFYVHSDHYDYFLGEMKSRSEALVLGDPTENETQFSSLIDERSAERVEGWINEALEAGANLVTGGAREGSNVQPTILTNTTADMKVQSEEVFGPVVCIEPYDDFETALNKVNDSRFGLQASVFTDSIEEMNKAFDALAVGGVIINDSPTFRVDHMPYGGIKDSGFGREGIKYAMREMLEPKILVKPK